MRSRSRAAFVVALVLAFSVVLPGLLVQGVPSLYPVIVTVGADRVLLASHSSDPEEGNWIELSGGTDVAIPDLTLTYEGPDSAVYHPKEGVTVSIESFLAGGIATYPLDTHHVYSTGQSISATFWGATALGLTDVDFKLISISSLAEAREIAVDAYKGNIDALRSKLSGATWSKTETIDGAGDASVTIPPKSVGNYILVVTNEDPHDIYVYSATIVEVVEQTLTIFAPSSVEKGDILNIDTGAGAISAAVLIRESAYTAEVKLVSTGTVTSTEIYLNDVKLVDGGFATEPLSIDTALNLLDTFETAFGSNEMSMSVNLFGGSLSIPTSSLGTGEYVLLAGVVKLDPVRIVGVYQKTVTVRPEYAPTPSPGVSNKPPVADAGPDQKAWVDKKVYFDGSNSKDPDGSILSYKWSFGDGSTASGETASHTYSEPGDYTVTLTVKDNRNAEDSDTCKAKISETPAPVTDEYAEQVPGDETGYLVDATIEANTTVTLNTTDPVTVTIIKYESNPHPDDPLPAEALPYYVDVEISDPDAVEWPIYVEMHYNEDDQGDIDESSLGIYYWKDEAWHRCSNTGVDTENNIVWAYMTMEEASGSPILIGGISTIIPPLPPILSDLTITPPEIEPGQEVTISLSIENIDDQALTYTITMQIGEHRLLIDVELEPYESKTVTHTLTRNTVGDYDVTVDGLTGSFTVKAPPIKPAEFTVSDLTVSPREVVEGDPVTITVNIKNIGEQEGSHTVILKLDGVTEETEEITLIGEASTTITFTLTEAAGEYIIEIDGLTDSFTVTAPTKGISPMIIIGILILIIAAVIYIYMRYISPYTPKNIP